MPSILGANSVTGDFITNSLSFNSADSPELTKTFGSAGGDTWSYSCWLKRGDISEQGHGLLKANTNAGLYFLSTGALVINDDGASAHTSTELFRDVAAWYHILFTGNGTTNKVYVNGTQLTFSGGTPNIGDINNNVAHSISKSAAGVEYMDGYLAEIHFVDGTEKAPTDFAETNDNGVWVPKKYTGSYGTNGFHLEFKQTGTSANASGIGADTSGSGNHFTPTNLAATDVTTDTPTNNFATLNPLDNAVLTLSEGNTKATHSTTSGGEENRATLGAANGKWYFEFQIQHTVGSLNPFAVGMMSNTGQTPLQSDLKTTEAFTSAWHTDSSTNRIESRVSGSLTNLNCNLSYPDDGDIVNVAMDLDNGRVFFGKNGTYIQDASSNTGNPSTGANPPVSFTTGGHFYFPAIHNRGSQGLTVSLNTGQPSFSISSGNADANGYGNFEYAVPSGYYAICTKNLAEYG